MIFISMKNKHYIEDSFEDLRILDQHKNWTDEKWIEFMNSQPNSIIEEVEDDPTIIHLREGETIEGHIKKYNLTNGEEIMQGINNLICKYYSQIEQKKN